MQVVRLNEIISDLVLGSEVEDLPSIVSEFSKHIESFLEPCAVCWEEGVVQKEEPRFGAQ
jgi:hypothetical protein